MPTAGTMDGSLPPRTGAPACDEGFYARLKPCAAFEAIGELEHFRPVPDDWLVVISDIRNSTPAIAAGRYKDVNMVGAASIVAALNAVPEADIPYVFGGDGATLAVPATLLEPVRAALLRTRALAASALALELRVGAVAVAEIRARGQELLLSRLEVSPGNHLALFAGGGTELADRLIKADADGSAGFAVIPAADADGDPDLHGLTCRWEPLKSRRGVMISLLVRANADDPGQCARLYSRVVAELNHIIDADPLAGRPVRPENMRFRWPPRGLRLEIGLTRRHKPWLIRVLDLAYESFGQYLLEKFDISHAGYNPPTYREEVRVNTDYRRFDGTLRVVFDCTEAEVAQVRFFLDAHHAEGTLVYGLHAADSALMTCLVFSLAEKRHLHFVDGNDGGFAMAARELKAQIRARAATPG